MAHRYFTNEISNGKARITGSDANHLARVLRAKTGELLILCDGYNIDYEAEILSVTPEEILLKILRSAPSRGEPTLWVEVFIGYAKGERMDWAIQKSVELGASVIHPFYSTHCVVKPKNEEDKNIRFTRIAHEAAKQCGRGILPKVSMPLTFQETIQEAAKMDKPLFLYEKGGISLSKAVENTRQVAIISGPEGGFSEAEAKAAIEIGCIPIGLGERILRSETAPAAALAAVMALTGNLE